MSFRSIAIGAPIVFSPMAVYTDYFIPSVVLIASPHAQASTILFANLTNAQENPPVTPTLSTGGPRPASFGTANFFLNDAQTFMTFTATIFNIDVTGSQTADTFDNLTAAHIHASATVTPTTNAPVVWGFFGAPFNDNTPNDFSLTPFATGVGGTFSGKWDFPEGNGTTLSAQLPNILSDHSYMNFHTTQFGGGEIRGTIVVVPEPATVVLLVVGAAALIGFKRLRVPKHS
jgi:CHRD domain